MLLCLFTLPLFTYAGVYRWVDANGQTHVGDRPPAQSASSEVEVNAALFREKVTNACDR